MADNTENIYVAFDYNNIIIVDPNKVIDSQGRAKERVVKQENLVIYANLECSVTPRTKLALGTPQNLDAIQIISLAEINFLNPGKKNFLDNEYTNEITGKDSLKGGAQNQNKINLIQSRTKEEPGYIRQTRLNQTDNGLLGITQIQIRQGLDFTPQITISLEDIKGRALFESGENSPYGAFFHLPYPPFYLTVKGYYGKALRLTLMLSKFNARYDSMSGNFKLQLDFYTYKYSVLVELPMGHVMAAPYMYPTQYTATNSQGTTSSRTISFSSEIGRQKLEEVYREYIGKKLLPENFQVLTIKDLHEVLSRFIKDTLNGFVDTNVQPLTNISDYLSDLGRYNGEVYSFGVDNKTKLGAWFELYIDKKNPYVTTDNEIIYYIKKGYKSIEAENLLKSIVGAYNSKLDNNPTCGQNVGQYTRTRSNPNGKDVKIDSRVPNNIKINTFKLNRIVEDSQIDAKKTLKLRRGIDNPTTEQENFIYEQFKFDQIDKGYKKINPITNQPDDEKTIDWYIFDGDGRFRTLIAEMEKKTLTIRNKIQDDITESLSEFLQNQKPLGFVPNIRNILGVIFANAEAFLRLMDRVHDKAWTLRENKDRIRAILPEDTVSADKLQTGEKIIYPWPQLIVNTGDDKNPKYEPRYPGDNTIESNINADEYDIWPEVEFVEEYISALTDKVSRDTKSTIISNELNDIKRLSINGIEFPITNEVYFNREIVKFIYEIFERINFTINYSRINRTNPKVLYDIISEIEKTNIYQSLNDGSSPELLKTLKNSNVTGDNYLSVLKQISNNGLGFSWNTWISGYYNTIYISNKSDNSFIIRPSFFMNDVKTNPQIGLTIVNENNLQKLLTGETKTNKIEFTDIYPFTNDNWINRNLADGSKTNSTDTFNTTKTIAYQNTFKTITNFKDLNDYTKNRPITHFIYKNISTYASPTYSTFQDYYNGKVSEFSNQLITEGNVYYGSTSKGNLPKNQTTSILNTPYFVNAIQKGVKLQKQKSKYPYVAAAYLLLNGLPLITGRERLKNYNSQDTTDYIYSTLKKYGAVHKLPYPWILKIGSLWYRYSKFINEGVDILDNEVWKDFDYINNYDPTNNSAETNYLFTGITSADTYNFVLQKDSINGSDTTTSINLGFYPKLINDFSYFYLGTDIINTYTSQDIGKAVKDGKLTILSDTDADIKFNKGFDKSNLNRQLNITSYSTYISGNTGGIYLLPSVGFRNQTKVECFKNSESQTPEMVIEVKNNSAMFNGSIRNFWGASNYGYFETTTLVKPKYNSYLKSVYNNNKNQENFTLNNNENSYSSIEDLFSIFDYKILESFKEEFLNFSKSDSDFNTNLTKTSSQNYNFQLLMKNMMKINVPLIPINFNTELIKFQLKKINSSLESFLQEDVYFVYGNPSNYNKKLFYSFSDLPLEGKFNWETYVGKTPSSLPVNGGIVTLNASKLAYPEAWKVLELYVGFSTIEQLKYDDNGSFITDFFIDFNVAFTELNIKNFAPIIKLYATQKLNRVQSNRINTDNNISESIVVYKSILSDTSTLTITQKDINKSLTNARETTVIFSDSSTESTEKLKNSFFARPEFSSLTVTREIVNIENDTYPNTPSSSSTSKGLSIFKNSMNRYLTSNEDDIKKIINIFWPLMTKELATIDEKKKRPQVSRLEGDSQTKLELWELFKSLNDKWISGNDYESKTLFEDVMLIDRASRNIGEKALVDIFSLKELLDPTKMNLTTDVYTFVESILVTNNFVVMSSPAYVNFYGVQNVSANPIPTSEGTLEFANTIFGTYLNVDYRNSSSKLICQFDDRKSEYLKMDNNPDYRFSDDSFDITRTSNHPLSESLQDKTDFDKSNKVVGFNVDIGVQNQQIIKSFSISQNAGIATTEALEILNQMANQGGHRSVATQNLSLYTLYKNRSYTCNLTMMGNALIQPTMYFNLRYVPMFSGPYMITEVNHSISQGDFSTDIVGVRQPIATLPILTSFLQGLRTNLIKKIEQKVELLTQSTLNSRATNIITQQNTAGLIDNTLVRSQDSNCVVKVTEYSTLTQVEFSTTGTTVSFTEMKTSILNSMTSAGVPNNDALGKTIFSYYYYNNLTNNRLETSYFNFGGVDLLQYWGEKSRYFELTPQYFCKSTTIPATPTSSATIKVTPYAIFGTLDLNTKFFVDWWKSTTQVVDVTNTDQNVNAQNISKFIILNRDPSTIRQESFFETYKNNNTAEYNAMVLKISEALNKFQTS